MTSTARSALRSTSRKQRKSPNVEAKMEMDISIYVALATSSPVLLQLCKGMAGRLEE